MNVASTASRVVTHQKADLHRNGLCLLRKLQKRAFDQTPTIGKLMHINTKVIIV